MTIAADIFTPLYRKLQRQFPLRPIRNKKDADAAHKILFVRFRDKYDDPGEEAYAMALSTLLGEYEDKLEAAEPEVSGVAALKHMMEANDVTRSQLADVLNVSLATVSQILNGNRQITADHARALGKRFSSNPGVFL